MHVTWNGYSKSQQLAIEGNLKKKTINYDGIASNANNPPPPLESPHNCGWKYLRMWVSFTG